MHTRSSSKERRREGAPTMHPVRDVTRQTSDAARPARMPQRGSGQHSSMAIATETSKVPPAPDPRAEPARLARRALASHGLHEDVEHTVTLLATEIVGN